MGLEAATVLAISAATTAATATAQAVIANEAAEDEQDIAQAQAAANKTREIEKRRRDVRQRRIAAARVRQAEASSGISGSSAAAGALGSLSTQGAVTTGQSTATQDLQRRVDRAQGRIRSLSDISDAIGSANQVVQGVGTLAIQANALDTPI
jgi:hypothetical protein